MFRWLEQIVSITVYSLRTLPQRAGSAGAAAFGIAGVVAVFVGVLSIAQGFRAAMTGGTDAEAAIVVRSGATTELVSGITREQAEVVAQAPGVARDTEGALASAELFLILNLPRRSTGTDANVPMRGVQPEAFRVRDTFRLLRGRRFEWGRTEVIVGAGAAHEFAGLQLGDTIPIAGERWRVVGVFQTGGLEDSEIWGDAHLLQAMYRRGDTFQSVYVKLEAPAAFERFRQALASDPRMNVSVARRSDYYAEQSTLVTGLITGLGTLVAGLMALGAVFGALNTMYSSVSSRTREIATLRALGYRAGPIVVAILVEGLLIALVGGTAGGLAAWAAFDGYRAATLNWQSFAQVAFAFDVTPVLLVRGILMASVIGLAGGLLPAIRAARLPVATALRAL